MRCCLLTTGPRRVIYNNCTTVSHVEQGRSSACCTVRTIVRVHEGGPDSRPLIRLMGSGQSSAHRARSGQSSARSRGPDIRPLAAASHCRLPGSARRLCEPARPPVELCRAFFYQRNNFAMRILHGPPLVSCPSSASNANVYPKPLLVGSVPGGVCLGCRLFRG